MKTLKYILLLLLMPGLLLAADPVPDEKNHKLQYKFSGAWLPDFDPALMGPENFRTLTNMRYTDGSIEGVQGYSKINTTALTTYIKPRSGIQLRTDRDVGSYFLIHAENTGLTASQVFQNQTAIPDQGDFEATALHTDASGAGLGRFSAAPDGSIAYTNGKEAYIWSGEEMRVGGFFTCDDSSGTNPKDKTVAVNNTLTDAANLATVNATQLYSMVLSVRPLQGIKCVPESPNTSAATLTVYTYDGSSFTECSNVVDGTS
ncbi:MAG: hypothetical protein GY849_21060, partial [Deltaproteobacteria bacterium]|nr:hypothetical protein [Deltaproteobacteria bacterium]